MAKGAEMLRLSNLLSPLFIFLICLGITTPVKGEINVGTIGEAVTLLLPATAVGFTIGLQDGKGALQLGESVALTAVGTYGLKGIINETAPNGDGQSFPSGHTALAFSSAEFLRKRYGWQYGLPAYAAATFVGVSRVESKNHYIHDVLGGAAIGIASSYLFTDTYKGWKVQPQAASNYFGIRLSRFW
jgi:membrane-associated phospholipid phosphatase